MDTDYRKDLSHITWGEVYARQMKRAALVAEWLDELRLWPGERVLDVGSGPGHVSLQAARRVGPAGLVYAVDRSAEALAYLERLQQAEGLPQIVRIVADAAALERLPEPVDAALVTMMLHHSDDPFGLLANVVRCLPPGARVVVAEFHPDGPGEYGPPLAERVGPEVVRAWCDDAGLTRLVYRRQSPEHYAFFAERGTPRAPASESGAVKGEILGFHSAVTTAGCYTDVTPLPGKGLARTMLQWSGNDDPEEAVRWRRPGAS